MPKTTTAKKPKPNGVPRAGAVPKRTYERTTPVGRVLKHLEKARKIANFAAERMSVWEHSGHPELLAALAGAREAAVLLDNSSAYIVRLRDAQWAPPKKSTIVVYAEGDEVRVAEKYRDKYLEIYPVRVIDNLVVTKCLVSGEIAVSARDVHPFLVAKSHLEKKRAKSSAASASSEARLK